MLDEIQQFPADLERREVEEMPDGFNFNILKCSVQANQGVLKNIIRCLPSPKSRVVPEHLASQFQQPLARMVQQQGLGPLVTRLC